MRASLHGRKLIIGVDRLDYSKGLPERFKAFGRLLEAHPESAARSRFLQVAPPSREEVHAYAAIRGARRARRPHQRPLRRSRLDADPLYQRSVPREKLAGLFRAARSAW